MGHQVDCRGEYELDLVVRAQRNVCSYARQAEACLLVPSRMAPAKAGAGQKEHQAAEDVEQWQPTRRLACCHQWPMA